MSVSVLDNIITNISDTIILAGSAAGYTNAVVLRDEYAVLNFPPDVSAEWVLQNALNTVIQIPHGQLQPGGEANYDKFIQRFRVTSFVYTGVPADADAMATVDLSEKTENCLKLTLKQLRGSNLNNVQRGGWADNTINFTFNRWAYGDGSGAGFTLEFDVIYRTALNDPDTKG